MSTDTQMELFNLMKSKSKYPFQERVEDFLDTKKRSGLFSFFGSGKTFMSIRHLANLRMAGDDVFPCLILCPKSLITQWGNQIAEHSHFNCSLVQGTAKQKIIALHAPHAQIYICNHDVMRSPKIREQLLESKEHCRPGFKSVIVDESRAIQETRTQRYRWLRALCKKIPIRMILCGQPTYERPEELFGQMLFLDDGESLGTAYWKFRHKYFHPGPPWKPYDWTLKPGAAEAIAKQVSSNCIRIPKEEVMNELPPKVYNRVEFEMPTAVRKNYEELQEEFFTELPSGHVIDTQWAVVRSTKMHQLCQGFIYKDVDHSLKQRN